MGKKEFLEIGGGAKNCFRTANFNKKKEIRARTTHSKISRVIDFLPKGYSQRLVQKYAP
jgi:hypothetical protein